MSNSTTNTRAPLTIRAAKLLLTGAALSAAALIAAAPASAHVHVDADHAERGGDATLTFQVPNESDAGAATTQLTIQLPNLTSVTTEQMTGWTARLDRDIAAGTVRSITWTAAPGAGVGPDQFALFRVAVVLPNTDTVSFPATQTYSDGTVVRWDQPTPAGGAEPEHPVPALTLTATSTTEHTQDETQAPASAASTTPDTTARWLAGAALVVAVAATALTVITRRRQHP
ncbi:hypothetical protein Mycsm_02035 [Mycobacterium sp. JS623]|uniref:YcnI family protein n=1 Tax=Mycobacterium sp. JS623 TaxID=212767 RepID=UPI0002A57F4C|nr:YcnI family protein [Mycobacterium sp. JS623]AGB22400.1 hypothetical protein Mycsm_02035 [Mycobacterium sp. JS623]